MTFSVWDHTNVFSLNEAIIAWMGVEPIRNALQIYQQRLDFLRKAVVDGKLKTLETVWDGDGTSYINVDPENTRVLREHLYEFFEGIKQYPKFLFDPEPPQNKEVIELKQRIAELEAAAKEDRPFSTRERRTLLTLLWVVAEMAELDLSHLRTAAETIALATQERGVPIGDTTIYEKLRVAKDFIPPP